jgi:hypothetical protein
MRYLPLPTAALLVLVDWLLGCCLALCRSALARVPAVMGLVCRLSAAGAAAVVPHTLGDHRALAGTEPVPDALAVLLVAQILAV